MTTSKISDGNYYFRPISSASSNSVVSLDSPTSLDSENELTIQASNLKTRPTSLPSVSFSDQTFLNSQRSHSLTVWVKDAGLSTCLFKLPDSETASQIEEMEEIEKEKNDRKNFTKEDWLKRFFKCIHPKSNTKMLFFKTLENLKKASSTLDLVYESRENKFTNIVSDPKDKTRKYEQDLRGMTLLGHAAYCGSPWQIKTLLEWGASVDFLDQGGYSPLSVAIEAGKVANARLLLQKKANPDAVNKENGCTPLSLACRWSDEKSTKFLNLLLPYIKNINGDPRDRPLHLTILSGKVKLTEILLKRGADRDAKDDNGQTALEVLGFYDPQKFPHGEEKHSALGLLLSSKVPKIEKTTRESSQLGNKKSKRPKVD